VTLPYENATSGKNALDETQRILRAFGASSFGVMEDFAAGTVMVQFVWRERRVSIEASSKGYAAAWLREHPWSTRMKMTQAEHQSRALAQGQVSVYSILRDWIKGQVTAVEVGMLSFEGAFLGQLMLESGRTVLQEIGDRGILKITAGPAA
jgi:hypothetical protein